MAVSVGWHTHAPAPPHAHRQHLAAPSDTPVPAPPSFTHSAQVNFVFPPLNFIQGTTVTELSSTNRPQCTKTPFRWRSYVARPLIAVMPSTIAFHPLFHQFPTGGTDHPAVIFPYNICLRRWATGACHLAGGTYALCRIVSASPRIRSVCCIRSVGAGRLCFSSPRFQSGEPTLPICRIPKRHQ
jgi:hypothetical protein